MCCCFSAAPVEGDERAVRPNQFQISLGNGQSVSQSVSQSAVVFTIFILDVYSDDFIHFVMLLMIFAIVESFLLRVGGQWNKYCGMRFIDAIVF